MDAGQTKPTTHRSCGSSRSAWCRTNCPVNAWLCCMVISIAALAHVSHGQSAASNTRYVQLDYTRLSTRDCGTAVATPCPSLEAAVTSLGAQPGISVLAVLETAVPVFDGGLPVVERLKGLRNVRIEPASRAHRLTVQLELQPTQTWLLLEEASNVSVSNINVTYVRQSFGTAISVQRSSEVSVLNCSFAGLGRDSHAVVVNDSWPVVVRSSSFRGLQHKQLAPGNDYTSDSYSLAAVKVSYACLGQCAANCSAGCSQAPSLSFEACEFDGLGFKASNTNLLAVAPGKGRILHSSGVNIDIAASAHGKSIWFSECSFSDLTSPSDPAIRMFFDPMSQHNRVWFEGCQFKRNQASRGAVFFLSFGALSNNTVTMSSSSTKGCLFEENVGYVEAGVGRVSFYENQGSVTSLVQAASQLILESCVFRRNVAGIFQPLCGGCFVVTYHSMQFTRTWQQSGEQPIDAYNVLANNCVFDQSIATLGGVFYLQKCSLRLFNSTVTRSVGAPVFGEASLVSLGGGTTFITNGAGLFALSGGAVSLNANSHLYIDKNSSAVFQNNTCIISGGAVFADAQTSTSSLLQTVEFATEANISRKSCFLEIPENGSIHFNSSWWRRNVTNTDTDPSATFTNNVAPFGSDVFANSFLTCYGTPLYPAISNNQPVDSLPRSTHHDPTGPSLSTGPAWLLFTESTCDCLKHVNGTAYWKYHRRCVGTTIIEDYEDFLLKSNVQYEEAIDGVLMELNSWTIDVLIPPREQFLLPWGTVLWRYVYLSQVGQPLAQEVANLTLYPAPGEEFTLSVKALDSRLSEVQVTLQLQVAYGDVLLRYGGLQFHRDDHIAFPSQHDLVDVALAGKPGTIGVLTIVAEGIIALHHFRLDIPFRLRPCHAGFQPTAMMSLSDAELYNLTQSTTRTVPTTSPDALTGLVCACASDKIKCSRDGYNATVPGQYWAGLATDTTSDLFSHVSRTDITNVTSHEAGLVARARDFQVHWCTGSGDFCSPDIGSDWSLRTTDPCRPGDKRTGILCTACRDGLSMVPLNPYKCTDCRSANLALGKAGYILLTFCYTFVLVTVSFMLGVGKGASFDTWAFAFQVGLFIAPQLQRLVTGTQVFYFGADHCISLNLTPAEQTATAYIIPLQMLLSLAIVYTLFEKVRWFRVKLASLSFFPILWLSIVWSHNYLTFTSVPLLTCPVVNGKHVFYLQPLTRCFTGSHLPFALLALFILILTAIPLPLSLVLARKTTRLRPFAKIYLAPLRDDRHWWIAYAMMRRVVVAALSVTLTGTPRLVVIIIVLQACLVMLHFAMPYKQPIDNYFEIVAHGVLSLLALFLLFPPSETLFLASVVVYWLPSIMAICIGLYHSRHTMAARLHQFLLFVHRRWHKLQGANSSGKESTAACSMASPMLGPAYNEPRARTASHYSFRDPLLYDTLQDIPE